MLTRIIQISRMHEKPVQDFAVNSYIINGKCSSSSVSLLLWSYRSCISDIHMSHVIVTKLHPVSIKFTVVPELKGTNCKRIHLPNFRFVNYVLEIFK